jgi:hypothetical protein
MSENGLSSQFDHFVSALPIVQVDLRPKSGSILGRRQGAKGENAMPMQSKSAALRQEIESSLASRIPAALSPQAVQAPRLLPIGNEAVNTPLGGGLPIDRICEFTEPASAGRTSLALSVLNETY